MFPIRCWRGKQKHGMFISDAYPHAQFWSTIPAMKIIEHGITAVSRIGGTSSVLGFTRIETRVVFCITGFVSCCWDLSSHVPQPFACSFFLRFPIYLHHALSTRPISSADTEKFICFQVKMWHRKIINLDFQNWGCSCKDIIVSTICMTRKCLACGKAGHRLESCSTKAAFEIRRLRAKLEKSRHKPGSRNNPGRQNRKKGWSKEKARKAYTKQSVRKTFWKNDRKTAVQDGLSFGRVCRRTSVIRCWPTTG